jgi:hypothetical protein
MLKIRLASVRVSFAVAAAHGVVHGGASYTQVDDAGVVTITALCVGVLGKKNGTNQPDEDDPANGSVGERLGVQMIHIIGILKIEGNQM